MRESTLNNLFFSRNMSFFYLANIILILHFLIAIFITSMFFLIPLGYLLKWKVMKNKTIRLLHLFLILFVSLETILGITCPLTVIENNFRDIIDYDSFISLWISKMLFFDLPSNFFLLVYILCSLWTIIMWKKFPPHKKRN